MSRFAGLENIAVLLSILKQSRMYQFRAIMQITNSYHSSFSSNFLAQHFQVDNQMEFSDQYTSTEEAFKSRVLVGTMELTAA